MAVVGRLLIAMIYLVINHHKAQSLLIHRKSSRILSRAFGNRVPKCLDFNGAIKSYFNSDIQGHINPSALKLSRLDFRGGSDNYSHLGAVLGLINSSADNLFNSFFGGLCMASLLWRFVVPNLLMIISSEKKIGLENHATISNTEKPVNVKSIQWRFLIVFWLLRMADWLQGPYFYEVYSSKIINGAPVQLQLVSKLFLVGFATTGIFGPWLGKFIDINGRKLGTLSYAVLYSLSAISTRSSSLLKLLLGRIAGGLGTSLLFSAPEAWLVGEHIKSGADGKWLGETFGWAYSGDALVAIAAGQIASMSAGKSGPSGPFLTSIGFLALGSLIAAFSWSENKAVKSESNNGAQSHNEVTIGDALEVMRKDKRILLIGAVQAFFEGAMYIFVLQWPPAIKSAIQAVTSWPAGASVPYGKVFSCFMASCLLGSTAFGSLSKLGLSVEAIMSSMLLFATAAMATASVASGAATGALGLLTAVFFLFEACVGVYFPSIGTLRSKYIPDSHRSVIMNLFGIPLNLIVVSVFLSIRTLGVRGALTCSAASLAVASACMLALSRSEAATKRVSEERT